jgi:hypothetical protein
MRGHIKRQRSDVDEKLRSPRQRVNSPSPKEYVYSRRGESGKLDVKNARSSSSGSLTAPMHSPFLRRGNPSRSDEYTNLNKPNQPQLHLERVFKRRLPFAQRVPTCVSLSWACLRRHWGRLGKATRCQRECSKLRLWLPLDQASLIQRKPLYLAYLMALNSTTRARLWRPLHLPWTL